MSHQLQLDTYTPPAISNTLTLASTLSFALAEIDRLKLEAKAMTNRADYAENLLLSLVVNDKTRSGSNANDNNSKNNGFTFPSPAALNALAALMSAESRATAAESQLAAVLSSLSELLRLNDTATDARRRFENIVGDERQKIVNSIDGKTKTCLLGHTSHASSPSPLPPTESASSSFTVPTRGSSSAESAIVPQLSIRNIHHPTLPRVRPRTISDPAGSISSQPPAKKLRTMQPPASIYQQPTNIHPDNTRRAAVCGYPPTATEGAPQFHQTQNPYPRPGSYFNQPRIPPNPPINANSITQNAVHLHQVQNPYPRPNSYPSYSNQTRVPSNPPANVNPISTTTTRSQHTFHQPSPPLPPPLYSQQPPNNNISANDNVDHYPTSAVSQSFGSYYARDDGIPDHTHHHRRHQDGHSKEQNPSIRLMDDRPRSNSTSNQLPVVKALPQNGHTHTDVKEAENPFNDLLDEWARRGLDRKSGVGACREQSEPDAGDGSEHAVRVEGTSDGLIQFNANVALSVVTNVQAQSQFHYQPQQMASSSRLKKEDSSKSGVAVPNTNDNVEGWSGSPSISPQSSYPSSINGESPGPTSTLTGLRHLGSLSTTDLSKAGGFFLYGYPSSHAEGEKTYRQCDPTQ